MINRNFVRCKVCSQSYTLRIYVTSLNEVRHSFFCYSCAQPISYRITKRAGKLFLRCENNCAKTRHEGMVVNISTEFPIERDIVHTDKIFPWLLLMQKAMEQNPTQTKEWVEQNARVPPASAKPKDFLQQEVEEATRRRVDLKDHWKFVDTAWSLYNDGKGDECFQYIEKNFKKLGYENHPHPRELIGDFLKSIGQKHAAAAYTATLDLWADAWKKNPQECANLIMYFYKRDEFTRTLALMHNVCSNYMLHFDELMQLQWFYLLNLQLTDGLILGSNNFESVRGFYGDTFERYSELLYMPTAIKNIVEGRSFDQLKHIDLETYSKSEKARRIENLKELPRLDHLTSPFDPSIRNATHHARIEFDKKALLIALKKGTKSKERGLTYVQYIDHCNRLFQAYVGLFLFCHEFIHGLENSFGLAHSLGVSLGELKINDPEFELWANRGQADT